MERDNNSDVFQLAYPVLTAIRFFRCTGVRCIDCIVLFRAGQDFFVVSQMIIIGRARISRIVVSVGIPPTIDLRSSDNGLIHTALFPICQMFQQSPAPVQDITPGGVKVSGVPGICYLLIRVAGVFHQEVHLVVEVAAANAVHVPQVGVVHADEQVVFVVVPVLELAGHVAGTGDAMLGQLLPGRRVDRAP